MVVDETEEVSKRRKILQDAIALDKDDDDDEKEDEDDRFVLQFSLLFAC